MATSTVKSGLELLIEANYRQIKGAKAGLLANQATVNSKLEHVVDLFHNNEHFELARLFAPEHGFRGELQDMDSVADTVDSYTGLPIKSLYGENIKTLTPETADLEDLDLLIVDLPDIGSRYYTFAQSMIYSMQVAAKTNTKVLVLDRPNPISGTAIEGAELKKSCRSFCGHLNTANRHGLTLGELADMALNGFGEGKEKTDPIDCELEVIKCEGWNRSDYFEATGLPWVYPSPNMPTIETAVIYPGSCLFEATEISEGRGTTKPLEQFGAPFISSKDWIKATLKEELQLEGAVLRPISFLPKFQKHAGKVCHGVQLHVTDRSSFKPFRWCLALIAAAKRLYPDDFAWRKQAFEFEDKIPAIDLLYGSDSFRNTIEAGKDLASIAAEIKNFESSYLEARRKFLLY